jgi:hypothetical protein
LTFVSGFINEPLFAVNPNNFNNAQDGGPGTSWTPYVRSDGSSIPVADLPDAGVAGRLFMDQRAVDGVAEFANVPQTFPAGGGISYLNGYCTGPADQTRAGSV